MKPFLFKGCTKICQLKSCLCRKLTSAISAIGLNLIWFNLPVFPSKLFPNLCNRVSLQWPKRLSSIMNFDIKSNLQFDINHSIQSLIEKIITFIKITFQNWKNLSISDKVKTNMGAKDKVYSRRQWSLLMANKLVSSLFIGCIAMFPYGSVKCHPQAG